MNIVLCVGNSMMGDDAAGIMLYEMLNKNPLPNWQALNGGSTPENQVHTIRQLKPECLVIVDATEMDLPVGEIRFVDKALIADMFIMSTHNLPLNFLIEQLEEDIPSVHFIGIQPDIVSFMFPMTEPVKQGVTTIYDALKNWENGPHFASL
ncbi:TPA: hydrogenase maturation peptidase HycI [Pasteurella multocida]|nr:hydrogenase maturation peptidase HycI [Pasteurella multocida]